MRISGIVKFGGASEPRRRDARGLRPADRADALRPEGPARPDPREGEARRVARAAGRRDPGDPPAGHTGPHRRGTGEGGREGRRGLPQLPPDLPARVRLHRALRRRVRDRELAVDHDRAADPRARHPADARRLAQAGALVDHRRGARDGHRSPRSPASSSASGSATGLFKLFDAVGFTLPNNGLVLQTRTIVVSLLVGIVVTLLASLRPAIQATRVPPISAVREGATLPPRTLRPLAHAVGDHADGARLRWPSPRASGRAAEPRQVLAFMGIGTLLIFFGIALLSARIARPFAWVLGWPAARFGGAAGALARDNARRNPQRTASTASALMIGLALVTLVAVLAAGITSTFRGAVNDLWVSGYAITAQNNFSPLPIAAGERRREDAGRRGDRERPRRRRAGLRPGDPAPPPSTPRRSGSST